MKSLQVTVCVLLVVLVQQGSGQGSRYIEKQLLCALDQAPCDVLGQQVKDALPEIIGRGCENCDRGQVNNARRIARFIQTRYPAAWAALVEKYSDKEQTSGEDRRETIQEEAPRVFQIQPQQQQQLQSQRLQKYSQQYFDPSQRE